VAQLLERNLYVISEAAIRRQPVRYTGAMRQPNPRRRVVRESIIVAAGSGPPRRPFPQS
jgi:hypothetical protein